MSTPTVSQTNIQLYNRMAGLGYSTEALATVQRAYELAARLYAGRFQASGREFLCHGLGVASLLADLGQTAAVVCAGLLHNVYNNGDFGDPEDGIEHDRRELVHNVVGLEAEDLVYRFAHEGRKLRDRARQEPGWLPESEVERSVVLVYIVDSVEKHLCDGELMNLEHYRQYFRRGAPADAMIAGRLGFPLLAEVLSSRIEAVDVDLLAEARGESRHSFVIVPRSYRSQKRE